MSVFTIKKSHAWNYSNPAKDGYSDTIVGTVTGIDNPQARDFQSGKPRFWEDGTPVRNIRVFILLDGSDEERTITFRPKGALFDAFAGQIDSFEELPGHKVTIKTKEGSYNLKNPRPWTVEVGEVNDKVKLHKVPVLDYDVVDPLTGREKDPATGNLSDIPF